MDSRKLAGTVIAGCKLGSLIAAGSMGAIYRGRHVALDRPVAVKAFSISTGETEAVDRLLAEARAIAKVEHPNVVQVYDVGLQDSLFYIVMQLLEGETLKAMFDESGPLPAEEFYSIMTGIGRGLGAIHERGIVHRDLKMENIMVGPDGQPRITDFGLVLEKGGKDEYQGRIVGTPAYISPEQWIGRPLDARADLYSLGVLVFTLATGEYPFPGPGATEFREQHLRTAPRRPSAVNSLVPEGLSAIILKLLSKIRSKRFQSAREFLDDLKRWHDGKPPEATRETGRAVRCPFCETVHPMGTKKCSVCGESLALPLSGSLDLQARSDEITCPSCGAFCEKDARACARCGKGICATCRKAPSVRQGLCEKCTPPPARK
jgi:serine/threonine protein kinase